MGPVGAVVNVTATLCAWCDKLIPARPHQGPDVRTCSPACAGRLHRKENPERKSDFTLRLVEPIRDEHVRKGR